MKKLDPTTEAQAILTGIREVILLYIKAIERVHGVPPGVSYHMLGDAVKGVLEENGFTVDIRYNGA